MRRAGRSALLAAAIALVTATPLLGSAQPVDADDALPPGHPPVEEQLPASHPQIGPGAEGAGTPRRGAEDPGFFRPPEDTVVEDPSLPPGVLIATVQDAEGRPIPRAAIQLNILHNSVAKGESKERRDVVADDLGTFRFEGLPTGSGTTYRVAAVRGPATFSIPPVALNDKVGKRAVVHSYEVATDVEEVFVGLQGLVYLQLREDTILVEHLFNVFNLGPVAWVPDVTFRLPEGFKAFNKGDSMDEMRFEEVRGSGVAIRGTVGPGRHNASFRYSVPFMKEERQVIRIELPPRVAQVRVIAEASKSMNLEVQGFPAAQRTQGQDGKKVLVTEQRSARAAGGVQELSITLSGLPTPSPWRWVALSLAGIVVVGALGVVFQRRKEGPAELDDDARRDLLEARDALLDEFVALERAHKRGDIGPKTYVRVREALLDALARLVAMVEASRPAGPTAKSAGAAPPRARKGRVRPALGAQGKARSASARAPRS